MQWASGTDWQTYRPEGEKWFGFSAVRSLVGLPPEVLLVPLTGHTRGHAGVAVQDRDGGWLLHAGDAYFYRGELDPDAPRCPPGLRAYQALMEVDRRARLANQRRLRELVRTQGAAVRVISAHDPVEFDACAAHADASA
jgi:glyoxylase-like metal-dependent hydrolase (beta-lactamase superfamily II)